MWRELFGYLKSGLIRANSVEKEQVSIDFTSLGKLSPFILKHLPQLMVCLLFLLIKSGIDIMIPLLYKGLIDKLLIERQLQLFASIIGGIAVLLVVSMLLESLLSFLSNRLEQEVIYDIQTDLFKHVLALPKSYFDKQETGYILTRLSTDVMGLRSLLASSMVQIISGLILMLGGIIMMYSMDWRLASAAIFTLPLFALFVWFIGKKLRSLGHGFMERYTKAFNIMNESVHKATHIKAFANQAKETERFNKEAANSKAAMLEQVAVRGISSTLVELLINGSRLIVLVVGVLLLFNNQTTIGALFAFLTYVGLVYSPVKALTHLGLGLQEALVSLERINHLYKLAPEDTQTGKEAKKLKGDIEFRNVSFSYGNNETVLEDISFKINSGERIAIVGASGAGKTSILSLLLCFYKPVTGGIYFDGINAEQYSINSLRKRIGYVSQNNILLSGTILENLYYGNPNANIQEVIEAAKAVEIHDFIESLPEGYNTVVTDGEGGLSQGQRQRISFARALICNADIIVLDEPTGALDNITEQNIYNSLPDIIGDRTIILVTHRIANIKEDYKVFYINNKRLAATGTHAQLLKTNTEYRIMVKAGEADGLL